MWNLEDNRDVGLEAAIIQRVRNSSPVKRFRAENVTGLKPRAEAVGSRRPSGCPIGREAFHVRRRLIVRAAGARGREYAAISNEKTGEKPVRRKPKVSWAMLIIPGLGGP